MTTNDHEQEDSLYQHRAGISGIPCQPVRAEEASSRREDTSSTNHKNVQVEELFTTFTNIFIQVHEISEHLYFLLKVILSYRSILGELWVSPTFWGHQQRERL